MTALPNDDMALLKFHQVLRGSDIERTKQIIDNLNLTAPLLNTFFLDHLIRGSLAPNIKTRADGALIVAGRQINSINSKSIGKGAFGETFKSASRAYKYIRITGNKLNEKVMTPRSFTPHRLNHEIRKILVEAWIQTILGVDSEHGGKICQIEGIFIQEGFTGVPRYDFFEDKFVTIVIQMKILKHTVPEYLVPYDKFEFAFIQPLLSNLTKILIYFNHKHKFVHRDLHMGNVMFSGREIAILDFGFSCIEYGHVTYGDPRRFSGRCWAFDMYTFMSSLLSGYGKPRIPGANMSDTCYGIIKNMFNITVNDKYGRALDLNLHDKAIDLVKTDKIGLPSHLFYPDRCEMFGITPPLLQDSMAHLEYIQGKLAAPQYPDEKQLLDMSIERTAAEIIIWSKIAAADDRAARLAAYVVTQYDKNPAECPPGFIFNAEETSKIAADSRRREADARARHDASVAAASRLRDPGLRYRAGGPPLMEEMGSVPVGKKAKAEPTCCTCLAGMFGCCPCLGGSRKKTNRKRKTGRRQRATRRRR
jgi:hypothetical protein